MKSFFHYCQGESHKSSNKPCQDCAYAESSPELSIAIVCDGHGGERYFRSQKGSELAVDVTKNAIKEFLKQLNNSSFTRNKQAPLFVGESFTDFFAESSTAEQAEKAEHQALIQLFSFIISEWNQQIALDAKTRELTEWEHEHVEQQYQDEFIAKRDDPEATFEKTYGCTLMAYVQTKKFWFAFHIGDGKFVEFNCIDGNLVCSQPIPWDERCFLNKTTSLCDSNALERFRYCYQGNGQFPLAVFLGSDGLDDSYGDGDNLYNFYIEIFKLYIRNLIGQSKGNNRKKKKRNYKSEDRAKNETEKALKRDLPKISKIGSKDDMSVAAILDESCPIDVFITLTDFQESKLLDYESSMNEKLNALNEKVLQFGNPELLETSQLIELQYAQNDRKRVQTNLDKNKKRIASLRRERTNFLKIHAPKKLAEFKNKSSNDTSLSLNFGTDDLKEE